MLLGVYLTVTGQLSIRTAMYEFCLSLEGNTSEERSTLERTMLRGIRNADYESLIAEREKMSYIYYTQSESR